LVLAVLIIHMLKTNSMRYVSPACFFNGTLPEPPDQISVRLRRTQLLADIEHSSDLVMEHHGEVLTKTDIMVLFDELEQERTLAWHRAIAKDPILRHFLDDIHFDYWAIRDRSLHFRNNPVYADPAFINWISPFFLKSFLFYMEMDCLKAANFQALEALLSIPRLMTSVDEQRAWRDTRALLEKKIFRIRRFGADASSEAELATTNGPWMDARFLELLPLLPEEHFADIRDKYALTIAAACANIHKKTRKNLRFTPIWLTNAIDLAVSPEVKRSLRQMRRKQTNALSTFPRRWISLFGS
jgi:hypothetical protein